MSPRLILLIPVLVLLGCGKSKPPQKPCPVCIATPAKVIEVPSSKPCLTMRPASLVKPFLVVDLEVKTQADPKYVGTIAEVDALMGWAADVAMDLVLAHKLCGPRKP